MCINFSYIRSSFLIILLKKGKLPQKCKIFCFSKLRKSQDVQTFWDKQKMPLTLGQCTAGFGRVNWKGYWDIAILEKGVFAPKLKPFLTFDWIVQISPNLVQTLFITKSLTLECFNDIGLKVKFAHEMAGSYLNKTVTYWHRNTRAQWHSDTVTEWPCYLVTH